jgi:large subunit ribosomal protein L25
MREITLDAEVRTQLGKKSGKLRREGMVPGIFYIHGEKNIPIAIQEKSLKPLIFTAETHVIDLHLKDAGNKSCIVRDIQFDPVSERPVHIDLQGLRSDKRINLEVPIILTGGTPVGVRDGGIIQHVIHRLKISCLPKDIPEHIEVNAEHLKMNQFVHVRDLKLEHVTVLENESSSIVGVVPPTIEKEETVAAVPGAEAPAEPEVIGKGKKPEEGAAEEGEKKPEAGAKAAAAPAKAPAAGAKTPPAEKEKK